VTAALTVGLAIGLAACGEDPPPPEPTPTVVAKKPTPSPSPSPSPSLTADELDLKAAEDVVLAYDALLDELERDPSFSRISEGSLVARDAANTYLQEHIASYATNKHRSIGESKVEIVGSVKNADGTWTVDACVDSTDWDVVGEDGKSVADRTGLGRFLEHHTVTQDVKNLKFYVIAWTNEELGSC
jgi:hypothetical protein